MKKLFSRVVTDSIENQYFIFQFICTSFVVRLMFICVYQMNYNRKTNNLQ